MPSATYPPDIVLGPDAFCSECHVSRLQAMIILTLDMLLTTAFIIEQGSKCGSGYWATWHVKDRRCEG
jgi:hypothetical protein